MIFKKTLNKFIVIRERLASQLLRSIFGIYFLIAMAATFIQLVFEFQGVKKNLITELVEVQDAFEQTLENAIWNIDEDSLGWIIKGIYNNPVVSGLKLTDEEGKVLKTVGDYFKEGEEKRGFINELIPLTFKLSFEEQKKDSERVLNDVGYLSIYSSNRLVLNRIQYGVILILINSIIKTTLLWVIMLYYINHMLATPIGQLTSNVKSLDFSELKTINLKFPFKNELSILKDSFNELIMGLVTARDSMKSKNLELEYYKGHLEEKVEERTNDLIKAIERAESANRSKSIFLANMSHEIRTPLNAILGFAEIVKDKVDDPKIKSYLGSIHSSGKSLLGLINDILDLSKVEAGKLELELRPINAILMFKEIGKIFQHRVEEKSLNFKVEIQENLPQFLVLDENRLRQILFNLLGNALKFTRNGSITLLVEYTHNPDEGELRELKITVKDTGIGIPEDQQKKIFEPFKQQEGQSNMEYGGTGLGLSITKKLVDIMGGNIWVESQVNIGSNFVISLPEIKIAEEGYSDFGQFSIKSYIFEPAKILVVDDIQVNRELITTFLSIYEFEFCYAENGKEAIEITKKEKPDMILMDIKMPVMNGITASEILKKDITTQHIPIIAVTASVMKESEKSLRKIVNGFVRKPVSGDLLVGEMAKFLKHRFAEEELATETIFEMSLEGVEPGDISRLKSIIEEELRSEYEEILTTLNMNDSQTFANKLIDIGNELKLFPLIELGKQIIGDVDRFDVEALTRSLETGFGKLLTLIDENEEQGKAG